MKIIDSSTLEKTNRIKSGKEKWVLDVFTLFDKFIQGGDVNRGDVVLQFFLKVFFGDGSNTASGPFDPMGKKFNF